MRNWLLEKLFTLGSNLDYCSFQTRLKLFLANLYWIFLWFHSNSRNLSSIFIIGLIHRFLKMGVQKNLHSISKQFLILFLISIFQILNKTKLKVFHDFACCEEFFFKLQYRQTPIFYISCAKKVETCFNVSLVVDMQWKLQKSWK